MRSHAGVPTRLRFHDITCAGCLDPAAATLQQLLLPRALLAQPAGVPLPPVIALSNVLLAGSGIEPELGAALITRMLVSQPIRQLTSSWSLAVYTVGLHCMRVDEARAHPAAGWEGSQEAGHAPVAAPNHSS